MNRALSIAVNVLVWVGLFTYLIVAARHCSEQKRGRVVARVEVTVKDSALQKIITPLMVKGWLATEGYKLKGSDLSRVNTAQIEQMVESRGFVKDASVYTDIDGVLNIELTQRRPIARVNTVNGYNFYITDDGYILPLQSHYVLYVPIITGNFTPPFERGFIGDWEQAEEQQKKKSSKTYLFFYKLINFVRLIGDNDFWMAQIVQINVLSGASNDLDGRWQEPQVEFVPRAGNHVVMMGSLDNQQQKLDKLLLFYHNALDYEGWDQQRYINLKFKDQIVCTK